MTRVTQSMLSNNMLRNLNTSYGKMSQLQDQINSGRKFTRASQDPVAAIKGMQYRVQLDKIGQFQRNMNEAEAWLDTTDTALDQVGNVLNRVKELVVQAANDTNTPDDREKIKKEIEQIREQMKDVSNTQLGGKYIFSGTHTQKPLFANVEVPDVQALYNSLATDAEKQAFIQDPAGFMQTPGLTIPSKTVRVLNTDAGLNAKYASEVFSVQDPNDLTKQVVIEPIDLDITVPANHVPLTTGVNGSVDIEVFDGITLTVNTTGGADIFGKLEETLKGISDTLANPNMTGQEIGDHLGSSPIDVNETIATLQSKVLTVRADVGAKMNRAELMLNRLDIHEINVTKQKSENEDTDYAKTITEMATQESIHQAALSVGAKIIQQTLVDFMR